jgi:hypothetical protein
MKKITLVLLALGFSLSACAHASLIDQFKKTCEFNPKLQSEKSAELLKIVDEDQKDRLGSYDSVDWSKVMPRDLKRRVKVAGIFAEGCLKSAADYAAAALVFQHGTMAGHFYQAFIWANEAFKLGDEPSRWLTAAGLDRYLVKVNQMQLFGTQLGKDSAGNFCLQPVEPTFTESVRVEYIKRTLKENTAYVLKGIGSTQTVEDTKDCEPALKRSSRGTVPGFW